MALSDWSTTPSDNATAPGIDWSEGMSPAQINNSARQMMADVAVLLLAAGATLLGINDGSSGSLFTSLQGMWNYIKVSFAKLDSPAFTGTPTAPTRNVGERNTNLATTAFVQAELVPSQQVLASAASVTPFGVVGGDDAVVITALSQNLTINAPSGAPVSMLVMLFRIKDNGISRTLTWNPIYRAIGVTLPTATVANKTLYVGFLYNIEDTKWDCVLVRQQA